MNHLLKNGTNVSHPKPILAQLSWITFINNRIVWYYLSTVNVFITVVSTSTKASSKEIINLRLHPPIISKENSIERKPIAQEIPVLSKITIRYESKNKDEIEADCKRLKTIDLSYNKNKVLQNKRRLKKQQKVNIWTPILDIISPKTMQHNRMQSIGQLQPKRRVHIAKNSESSSFNLKWHNKKAILFDTIMQHKTKINISKLINRDNKEKYKAPYLHKMPYYSVDTRIN